MRSRLAYLDTAVAARANFFDTKIFRVRLGGVLC